MKILVCSDGMPASENAIELTALLAGPLTAEITLLGIAEKPSDEGPLRETLQRQAQSLRIQNAQPNIVIQGGEPVRQILHQTSDSSYDLVIVGARWTGATGHY
ncbi:MAG TPA: universal stress protein, partial [Candidatus Udaeobacter sp.]